MEVADNAIEGTALTVDLVELATEKITSGRAAVGADGVPPPARLTGSAVAEKCEGAWAPWALDSPHKLALDELDVLIKKGRLGEIVIQAKAGGADSVRILSGFVFAFAVQQLMAQEDTDSDWVLVFMSLSVASGLAAVLLLTFLSAKIHRLVGRSTYRYGTGLRPDVCAQDLLKMPGQEFLVHGLLAAGLLEKQELVDGVAMYKVGQQRLDGDVKLAAREWYHANRMQGARHFVEGLRFFKLQLFTYAISVVLQLWDMGKEGIATGTATAILVALPVFAALRLHASGAVYDLA